ncbi:MAG: hypothetical protein U9N57_05345 [Pseudomonadota bacterium]|nr:hypothetical protein [Pseudomonadota bacterium]
MNTLIKTIATPVFAASLALSAFSANAGFDMSAVSAQQEASAQMQERMEQMASNMDRTQAMQENMEKMSDNVETMQRMQEQLQAQTQLQTRTQEQLDVHTATEETPEAVNEGETEAPTEETVADASTVETAPAE